MNYTPSGPSFEDMRDGILASVENAGAGHDCLIWEAFAAYGVGVGAPGPGRARNTRHQGVLCRAGRVQLLTSRKLGR